MGRTAKRILDKSTCLFFELKLPYEPVCPHVCRSVDRRSAIISLPMLLSEYIIVIEYIKPEQKLSKSKETEAS